MVVLFKDTDCGGAAQHRLAHGAFGWNELIAGLLKLSLAFA
jgi:hypothetical protein